MQSQRTAAKYKDLYDYVLISMWLYIKPFASWGLLALRQFLKENSSQKGKILILLEVRCQSRKGDFTCRVSCQAMLCSALGQIRSRSDLRLPFIKSPQEGSWGSAEAWHGRQS